MKTTLNAIKSLLLLLVLLILGWSAMAGPLEAEAQSQAVFCEASGDNCHVIIGNDVYHLEKQPEAY